MLDLVAHAQKFLMPSFVASAAFSVLPVAMLVKIQAPKKTQGNKNPIIVKSIFEMPCGEK